MAILGSLALLLSGIGIALLLVRDAERCVERTRGLLALVRFTKTSVSMYSMSVSEILKKCSPELLRECGYQDEAPLPASFSELLAGCEIPDKDSRAAFADFAESFGNAYRAEEILRCEECIEKLRKREMSLSSALPSKKKIIFSVSLCSALSLLILLL